MCFQHFASPTVWPCLGLTGQSDSSWTEFGEKGFQTRTDLLKTKYPPRTWSTVEYQPGFCCHLTGSASSSSWDCRQTSPYRVIFCVCRQVHCNQSILLIALSGTEQNVVQFIMKPEHKYCLFRTIVPVLCTFPALGMKQNSWVWRPASNWSFSFPVPQLAAYWIYNTGWRHGWKCLQAYILRHGNRRWRLDPTLQLYFYQLQRFHGNKQWDHDQIWLARASQYRALIGNCSLNETDLQPWGLHFGGWYEARFWSSLTSTIGLHVYRMREAW